MQAAHRRAEKRARKKKTKKKKDRSKEREKAKKKEKEKKDAKLDGRHALQASIKEPEALFGGTGLSATEKVRRRVIHRAKKFVKKKKDKSSSSSTSSSEGSSSHQEDAIQDGVFVETSRARGVFERYPGVLTEQSLRAMRTTLLQEIGEDPVTLGIKPVAVAYFRQQLARKLNGPAGREALTLCMAMDLLLRGRACQAMDVLAQRLKSVEAVSSGTHWQVAQRMEVTPPDLALIAQPGRASGSTEGIVRRLPHAMACQQSGRWQGQKQERTKRRSEKRRRQEGHERQPKGQRTRRQEGLEVRSDAPRREGLGEDLLEDAMNGLAGRHSQVGDGSGPVSIVRPSVTTMDAGFSKNLLHGIPPSSGKKDEALDGTLDGASLNFLGLGPQVLQKFLEVLPLRSQTMGSGGSDSVFPFPTSKEVLQELFPGLCCESLCWLSGICLGLNSFWGESLFNEQGS